MPIWTVTDLTGANFEGSILTGASFDSTLIDANLTSATVTGASFFRTTERGLAREQLYSTANFQQKNMQGIWLVGNDLSGWNLSGQNLSGAIFTSFFAVPSADLTNADLTGANLSNTVLPAADAGLSSAIVDLSTIYNQWTVFSTISTPQERGLTFKPSPEGDFDANDLLGLSDIDMLAEIVLGTPRS